MATKRRAKRPGLRPVFAIENLGPIRHARFEIRPMTLMLGPNNSGKSMLSTFLYALGKGIGNYRRQSRRHSPYLLDRMWRDTEPAQIEDIAYDAIRSEIPRLTAFLRASLVRTYGGGTSQLVRWGSSGVKASLVLEHLTISVALAS